MPIPTDYLDIVKALATKTNEGDVKWRKDKYDIAVTVDNSKFAMWAGNDEHSDEPFVAFGLSDTNGKVVDSWFVDESDPDYSEMYQFYKSANRHALGVPNRLKELNALIKGMKIVGVPDET